MIPIEKAHILQGFAFSCCQMANIEDKEMDPSVFGNHNLGIYREALD